MQINVRTFGGPRRYIQGPGALALLAVETGLLGHLPLLLTDRVVCSALEASLRPAFPSLEVALFEGQCSTEEINRVTKIGREANCDVVVGAGGGKALDVAKAVASDLGVEVVIVPTVASNDAATSRLSVLYDASDAITGVRTAAWNPSTVIVDTALILKAPRRFFVAGIGDSLSKRFEAQQCRNANGRNFHGGSPPLLAKIMADACYDTLLLNAKDALSALERGVSDNAFENTVEATVLLSGLAFETGGLSIAHALTRGLSAVPELAHTLHGEQVAYGLVVQRAAECASDLEMTDLLHFMGQLQLPRNLHELAGRKIDYGRAIAVIVEKSVLEAAHHLRHFHKAVDSDLLVAAMQRVEIGW